eukprot:1154799-Pelagomonas_calceolata.AAC.6
MIPLGWSHYTGPNMAMCASPPLTVLCHSRAGSLLYRSYYGTMSRHMHERAYDLGTSGFKPLVTPKILGKAHGPGRSLAI